MLAPLPTATMGDYPFSSALRQFLLNAIVTTHYIFLPQYKEAPYIYVTEHKDLKIVSYSQMQYLQWHSSSAYQLPFYL